MAHQAALAFAQFCHNVGMVTVVGVYWGGVAVVVALLAKGGRAVKFAVG